MKQLGLVALVVILGGCAAPPPSVSPSPSTPVAPTAGTDELQVSIVADPQAAARLRVMQLGGSPCISEREAETDMARVRLDLDRHGADVVGIEGPVPGAGVKAYIGTLPAAAKAFEATELLQSEAGHRAVAIMRATGVQGAPEGAPVGRLLVQIKLSDGRTAWVQLGDYVASVPCSPEPAAS
jgi:lysophospholipase L1-like esterase